MQTRSLARKSEILTAARRLLLKHGYEKMTIEMIAREARAAVGSVTYFFKTKEGIAVAVADEMIEAIAIDAKAALQSGGDKVEPSIRNLVAAALAWPKKFPGYRELALATPSSPAAPASRHRRLQRRLEAVLADWAAPQVLEERVAALSSAELFAIVLAPAITDTAEPVVRASGEATHDWAEMIRAAAMKAIRPATRKTDEPAKPPKSGALPDLFGHVLTPQRVSGRKGK